MKVHFPVWTGGIPVHLVCNKKTSVKEYASIICLGSLLKGSCAKGLKMVALVQCYWKSATA